LENSTERLPAFESERRHLLSVAFRILGSQADAEDVVQEAWVKYDRADTSGVQNLPAWLTTVVSRSCIDLLRRRRDFRRAENASLEELQESKNDTEETALLASELVTAFTIVLEELTPPQRVALVLHDAFALPFDEVAHILGTTPQSAKKLASRARQRVRRRAVVSPCDRADALGLVQEFLRAAQNGSIDGLVALLDADVIRLADPYVLPIGGSQRLQGVRAVVEETVRFRAVALRAHVAHIDGEPGIVAYAPRGLQLAIVFRIAEKRISQFEVIADPRRLAILNVDPRSPHGMTPAARRINKGLHGRSRTR
jgi:RNA polymerase sigma factor (sigma-70 family)